MKQKVISLYKKNMFFRFFAELKFSLIPFGKISGLLPYKGKICELGAGYGFQSAYLALEYSERSVLGVDMDPKRINIARAAAKGIPNLDFLCADVNQADFPKSDGILMVSILHHLPYPAQQKILKKCYDALGTDGVLVILDPVNHPPLKYFMNWFSDWILYPFSSKTFFQSKDGIIDLLLSAGFKAEGEIEKNSGWGFFSYALVVGRKPEV